MLDNLMVCSDHCLAVFAAVANCGQLRLSQHCVLEAQV